MYYVFSSKTGRILSVSRRGYPLNALPIMCTEPSREFPSLIKGTDEVIPIFQDPLRVDKELFIPLFHFIELESSKYLLVNTPDNETFPVEVMLHPNYEEYKAAYQEYWSLSLPTVLCRDIRGYFLSSNPSDQKVCIFTESDDRDYSCFVSEANNPSIVMSSYTTDPGKPNNVKYLKKMCPEHKDNK